MDSYVPPVEAYSDKADPEWTDSQPEFPEAAGVGGDTQIDEDEDEKWDGPPIPDETPEETPKETNENLEKKETLEELSEDEALTQENFMEAVLQDESLGMDRKSTAKVYTYLRKKMKELGITFGKNGAFQMKHQLSVGSPVVTAPKDPLAEPMGSRPDSQVLKDLEERHALFDSSQEGTVQRGSEWGESPDRSLEEKMEVVPEHDKYAVALQHEMNEEKEERRRKKKEKKIAEAEACFPSSPEAPKEKPIQWGPITAQGRATFLAAFGQEVQPINMDFAQLVEYSLSADVSNLPDSIPENVTKTIKYIRELHDTWMVYDFEDIDWWLGHQPGPWYFCPHWCLQVVIQIHICEIYLLTFWMIKDPDHQSSELRGLYNPNDPEKVEETPEVPVDPRSTQRPVPLPFLVCTYMRSS